MGKRKKKLGMATHMKNLNMTILAPSMKKVENLNEHKVCRWLASRASAKTRSSSTHV
jgi:hypothetical protein